MINPLSEEFELKISGFMILSDIEVARLRRLLLEIDKGLTNKRYKSLIANRTRNIRLMLVRAERREKNTLL